MYCLTFCLPFIAPVMVSEQRAKRENWFVILKFIFGRLIGYIAFGALFGYLGERLNNQNLNLIVNFALLLLSLILILHALNLLRWENFSFSCHVAKHKTKLPLLMGFLMGVNICPPFLMSLTYVFTLHSTLRGIIYFLMFFLGTTLYFLPLFFLGYLNKIKEFQVVGRVTSLIVGMIFFSYGLYNILKAIT